MTTEILFFDLDDGMLADCSDSEFPTNLYAWNSDPLKIQDHNSTHFGFIYRGPTVLHSSAGEFTLQSGMYFSAPGATSFEGGKGIALSRINFMGLFQLGGSVEKQGRLEYIDGCTDTLLLSPPVAGDPCLNLLVIPPNTHQTAHTHPSLRAGIIVSGRGTCVTSTQQYPLESGDIFLIPAQAQHSFHTKETSLSVIAFHPDSDFGPSNMNHPMLNRTIINGVPASICHRRAVKVGV